MIKNLIRKKLEYHFNVMPETATPEQFYRAVAMTLQDRMSRERADFNERLNLGENAKRAYYLCMEFLLGRSLRNNLFNLELTEGYRKALAEFGVELDDLFGLEPDAGLGNGGLGRLAACYLDAAAGLGYPVTGYSILYECGIFRQKIVEGWQTELPDNWLPGGDVWLVQHIDEAVPVTFDGALEREWRDGRLTVRHTGGTTVMAVPYDMMITGGREGGGVATLRLWSAQSPGLDIDEFNRGNYLHAMEKSAMAEVISKVLYPSDNHFEGKSLRLRQQYFLAAASVSDILRRHFARGGTPADLPERAAIHINETHPALAVPELMRILMDERGCGWDEAWDITRRTMSYTNHTIMNEALEIWPESLIRERLPRIYEIIAEIDARLPARLKAAAGSAIFADGYIRMANLCVEACHSVNGVSKIHSGIIRERLFPEYAAAYPGRFTNVTNGIAYRRWLCQANPELSDLVRELIGPGFLRDAAALGALKAYADDGAVLARLAEIKRNNKARLAAYLAGAAGTASAAGAIDPESIFDVQAKRLHEYKRQLLKILHVLHLYGEMRNGRGGDGRPVTFIFGAKAAPGYVIAKQIIRLICCAAAEINADKSIAGRLRVVFMEDYRVTPAEMLVPAAEISEQISLAGTEASGTGNMKFMINGAVTLGTLDGANIEIRDAAGSDNILIFGMKAEEVERLRACGYSPTGIYQNSPALRALFDKLRSGVGGVAFPEIADSLLRDPYMVLQDFGDYCRAYDEAMARYADPARWNRMALMNIASAGIFSAERALGEYAGRIWNIAPAGRDSHNE